MKEGLKKVSEEIGKHFFNIGVAIIVFAIIQPIIKDEFNLKISIAFGSVYLIIFLIATFLIIVGGSKSE